MFLFVQVANKINMLNILNIWFSHTYKLPSLFARFKLLLFTHASILFATSRYFCKIALNLSFDARAFDDAKLIRHVLLFPRSLHRRHFQIQHENGGISPKPASTPSHIWGTTSWFPIRAQNVSILGANANIVRGYYN